MIIIINIRVRCETTVSASLALRGFGSQPQVWLGLSSVCATADLVNTSNTILYSKYQMKFSDIPKVSHHPGQKLVKFSIDSVLSEVV